MYVIFVLFQICFTVVLSKFTPICVNKECYYYYFLVRKFFKTFSACSKYENNIAIINCMSLKLTMYLSIEIELQI